MLLEIDEQSEQPIYQQLIDQIIVGIAKGELVPNESLPSIRQLADEIGKVFYISNPKQKSKHLFRKFIKILIRKGVHYNGGILLFHPSFCRFFYGIYYGDLCKSSQKYYFGKYFTRR